MLTKQKQNYLYDLDLRRWPLETKEEINFFYFKAEAWILNFKRKHGIVSKITKFINRSSKTNQEQIAYQKLHAKNL